MPHHPPQSASRQGGTMLTSTACLLAAVAFFAGLLCGTLLPHEQDAPAPAVPPPVSQENDLDDHIAQVRKEIARNPDAPLNWIHLGNLYFDAHNAEEAIAAYEKALQLKPGDVDVMTDLGTMYRLANQPQRALDLYDQVLTADPAHQNARFNKGVTLAIDLARPADGVAAWRDLLARNPAATIGDSTPLATALAPLVTDAGHELHKQGKHEAALQAYEEALRIDPNFAPAQKARAALLNAEAAATVSPVAPPPPSENAPARP